MKSKLEALKRAQEAARAAEVQIVERRKLPPVGAKKRTIAGEEWELMFADIRNAAEALRDPAANLRRATAVRQTVADWVEAFGSANNPDLNKLLGKFAAAIAERDRIVKSSEESVLPRLEEEEKKEIEDLEPEDPEYEEQIAAIRAEYVKKRLAIEREQSRKIVEEAAQRKAATESFKKRISALLFELEELEDKIPQSVWAVQDKLRVALANLKTSTDKNGPFDLSSWFSRRSSASIKPEFVEVVFPKPKRFDYYIVVARKGLVAERQAAAAEREQRGEEKSSQRARKAERPRDEEDGDEDGGYGEEEAEMEAEEEEKDEDEDLGGNVDADEPEEEEEEEEEDEEEAEMEEEEDEPLPARRVIVEEEEEKVDVEPEVDLDPEFEQELQLEILETGSEVAAYRKASAELQRVVDPFVEANRSVLSNIPMMLLVGREKVDPSGKIPDSAMIAELVKLTDVQAIFFKRWAAGRTNAEMVKILKDAGSRDQRNLAALRARRSHTTEEKIILGTYVLDEPIKEAVKKVKEAMAESYEKKTDYRIEIRPSAELDAYLPRLTRQLVTACAHLLRDLPPRMRFKQLIACLEPQQYLYVKHFMKYHSDTFQNVWKECALALDYYDPKNLQPKKELVERVGAAAADLIHDFMDFSAAKRFLVQDGIVEAYEAAKRTLPEGSYPRLEEAVKKRVRYLTNLEFGVPVSVGAEDYAVLRQARASLLPLRALTKEEIKAALGASDRLVGTLVRIMDRAYANAVSLVRDRPTDPKTIAEEMNDIRTERQFEKMEGLYERFKALVPLRKLFPEAARAFREIVRDLVLRLRKESTFAELERWEEWLAEEEKEYKPSRLTLQAIRESKADKRKKSFPSINEPESVLQRNIEAAGKKGDRDALGEAAYELVLWDMKRARTGIMEDKSMFGDPEQELVELLRSLPEKYAREWEEIYRKWSNEEVNERRAAVKQRFDDLLPPSARILPGASIQRVARKKLDLSSDLARIAEFVIELPAGLQKTYGARRATLNWFQPNLKFLSDLVKIGSADCSGKPAFVLGERIPFGRFGKLLQNVSEDAGACVWINDVLDRERVGRVAKFVFVRNVPDEYKRPIPGYSLEEAEKRLQMEAMTPADRAERTEAERMISIRRGGWAYPTMALVRAIVSRTDRDVEFGAEVVRESGGKRSYSIEKVAAEPVKEEIRENYKKEELAALKALELRSESSEFSGCSRRECEKCGSTSGVFRTHSFSGQKVVPVHICATCADDFSP